jgi:hypothetical protein
MIINTDGDKWRGIRFCINFLNKRISNLLPNWVIMAESGKPIIVINQLKDEKRQ